jgi:hypothetical protein
VPALLLWGATSGLPGFLDAMMKLSPFLLVDGTAKRQCRSVDRVWRGELLITRFGETLMKTDVSPDQRHMVAYRF